MQIILNGLISGLTLAVLALSFQIVYRSCNVFYLALAGVYSLVPYFTLICLKSGCPIWFSVLAAILIGAFISVLMEVVNHGPLNKKQASGGVHFVSSLGLYLILVQLICILWGNEAQVLRKGMDVVYRFNSIKGLPEETAGFLVSGLIVTRAQVLAGIGSLFTLIIFYCWLHFSRLGLLFRAMADNPVQLSLLGYNIKKLRIYAFALSGFLASFSSLATANDVGFEPYNGLSIVLLAIVAVVIGGKSSFLAPLLGGLLLGLLRAIVVWFLSARWQDAVVFLILALFLFIRPQGILGKKFRLEVEE